MRRGGCSLTHSTRTSPAGHPGMTIWYSQAYNKVKHTKDANSVIGKDCVTLLLEYAKKGDLEIDEIMEEIANKMHPNVRGEYKKKVCVKNIDAENVMRAMLNKWYAVVLYQLKDGEGCAKLIEILEDVDEVKFGELVMQIKKA